MAIRIVTDGKTITTCTAFDATMRLSAGGSWSFSMPAASVEAGYVAVLKRMDCYWDHLLVASGYIKDFDVSGDVLTVRGDDMAFELAGVTVSADATGLVDAADAIDWIGDELPDGWTLDNQVSGSSSVFMSAIARESILATLGAICTAAGLWFVIDGTTLTVSDSFGAVRHGVQVLSLTKRTDSNEIVTKVFPYGAGDKNASVTLQPSTTTVGGYTISKAANSVTKASSYPTREREVQFSKIIPKQATEAALIEASNALVLASVEYLRQHATPIESYSVECFSTARIKPLERIALNLKTDALLVNETPVVIESRLSVNTQGMVTTALTLEKDARRIPTDAQVVASAIVQGHNNAVYPTPKSENPAPSASEHVTHSGSEFALKWSIGEKAVQIRKATLTGSTANTGVTPGMSPTGLEYRLNGAGSWVTLSGSVDLTGTLANAGTGFPTATEGVVNVRVTGAAELIRKAGATWSGVPAISSGTKVLILEDTPHYFSTSNKAGLNQNGTIPAGTVVTINTSPTDTNPYDTNEAARWYACDYAAFAWLLVYVRSTTSGLILEAINGETSAFDANADATLSIEAVTI